MTVRTPGLTWVRIAQTVSEAMAILQAATLPGCEVKVRDRLGEQVTLDRVAAAGTSRLG